MQLSVIQALLVALLVSGSLAAPVAVGAEVGNFAPELAERHHTEAQIAAKEKAKEAKEKHSRDVPAPDEFGPWDSTEDEFGSWVTPREVEAREPHHTEAQIAAKEKAAAEKASKKKHETREPHHTEAQIAAKEKAAAEKASKKKHETREPHHTEAQIAAKEKAAAEKASKKQHETREPHHTEAQIAAKEKAAEEKASKKKHSRDVPAPDEFGPWDSTEDEFGSWVTPREVEAREAHHTEAQIAAKEKAAEEKATKKKHSRDVPAPDEFGPWDSTEDEFGSWVTPREVEAREAHHTEAQIAAKEAKAKKEGKKSA
ncbi:MAG: hypothetical protein MMC33_002123 [Icmadophila ericetorum]|nr:hypothetical protein [Icmadophila ericetorum]